MPKAPKIGDVIEVMTSRGLAYLQYVFRHTSPPVYGELVRVLPGLYDSQPDLHELAQQKERFFVFYPVIAACKRGLARVVGKEDVSGFRFPVMRQPGLRDRDGNVLDWFLWNGEQTWQIHNLTEETKQLSIAAIWNHELLIERIDEGWSPRDEPITSTAPSKPDDDNNSLADGNGSAALQALLNATLRPDAPHTISHYLYFPSKTAAEEAAASLRSEQYEVDVRPGADDVNWLALISHSIVPSSDAINKARSRLEEMALAMGGEYDGWEMEVLS